MQDKPTFVLDFIQGVLDENNGFIAISKLSTLMNGELREQLGIKPKATVKVLLKKLEPLIEENFILHKKGSALYILTPSDPASFVLDTLSEDKPATVKEIAKVLKPFTNSDIAAIVTELVNTGRVNVAIDEKFTVRVYPAGQAAETEEHSPKMAVKSGEYTSSALRKAYDELHKFREFVRICDMRRTLNWPRDTFDQMIRTLRDDRTIQIFRADESMLTKDEVQDCFVDENNFIMGTIIWNGR